MINGFQVVFLVPLLLLPFTWSRDLYEEGVRYTKGSFATLLILMNQWFAPTRLSITFEREGQGRFSDEQIEQIVVRNTKGKVLALKLPTKSILIANHQMYADWWYAWCLTYFMGTHKDVFIVLKKSLKWLPIVGWAMQFFKFIFLARSWASDRIQLASDLSALGLQAEREDKPFTLLLYPEGTLVSKDTRPISRKFADKMGIPDMTNILLPRSTGLHHSLRSLAPRVPALQLIDITIVYPGIPPMKYGQDYYTLRSIFFDRVPPPVVHMHLRVFDVSKDVPIGDVSVSNPSVLPKGQANGHAVEVDFPEEEKAKFDLWLRELWRDKDELVGRFYQSVVSGHETAGVDIPLELRHKSEIPDAFCFFLPALFGFVSAKLRRSV
jgi:1-acyl-sn-glycerol-3-phosphate acyltransferase